MHNTNLRKIALQVDETLSGLQKMMIAITDQLADDQKIIAISEINAYIPSYRLEYYADNLGIHDLYVDGSPYFKIPALLDILISTLPPLQRNQYSHYKL